jgi:conjugal transfer pilus assembly protein TraB
MIDFLKGKSDQSPADAKENQNKTKLIVFSVIAAVFIIGTMLTEEKKEDKGAGKFQLVEEKDAVKTNFMGGVKTEITGARRDSQEIQREYRKMKEEMKRVDELEAQIVKLQQMVASNGAPSGQSSYPKSPMLSNQPQSSNPFLPPMGNAPGGLNDSATNTSAGFPPPPGAASRGVPMLKQREVKSYVPMDDAFGTDIDAEQGEPTADARKSETVTAENILPSGTIMHVSLLSGIDAPTLAKAKKQPVPLLMKVLDLGVLPNNYRYDVESCFVLGEGYGDLSSERIYIRTTNLSCVNRDGTHIDGELSGFVAGPDAKNGIRGRVVSKQGALLARTAFAGFLKGTADGFNMQNQVVTSSALGTTVGPSNMATEDILQMGAFNGMSEAADRLAEFYLTIAEEITPVIELSANTEADVVVTEFKIMDTLEEGTRRNGEYGNEKKQERDIYRNDKLNKTRKRLQAES